jgi:hypothetical protein
VSTDDEYVECSSTSGDLYHKVTTTDVRAIENPYNLASPKSAKKC